MRLRIASTERICTYIQYERFRSRSAAHFQRLKNKSRDFRSTAASVDTPHTEATRHFDALLERFGVLSGGPCWNRRALFASLRAPHITALRRVPGDNVSLPLTEWQLGPKPSSAGGSPYILCMHVCTPYIHTYVLYDTNYQRVIWSQSHTPNINE